MSFGNWIAGSLAAVSLMAVSLSGISAVSDHFRDPLIEGYGVYEGVVHPGELVPILWTITKRTTCDGVSGRVWDGEDRYKLTEAMRATIIPVGTDMKVTVMTRIPETAPAGELRLSVKGYYDCRTVSSDKLSWFMLGPVVMVVDGVPTTMTNQTHNDAIDNMLMTIDGQDE